MGLQPLLIAPFVTGLNTDLSPWIAPTDSFRILENCHIKHGAVQKRSGLQFFASLSQADRVMGIGRYISADGSKLTLAWDTTRAYRYNSVTHVFDILDAAPIMSGDDQDYIWFVNWQASGGLNRLYFSNGKAYDGASLDGIRYYDNAAAVTNSFTPSLNTTGTIRKLYGAKLMFTLKQRLVVFNTYENDTLSTTNFPQRMRWCKAQNPSNWDDVAAGGGGFVDAPTGEQIISGRLIQDQIVIFFTNSVWVVRPTSDPALPFRWFRVNSFRACDGKMASQSFDRFVTSLGVRGISQTDTNQSTRIDDKIQNFVVNNINVDEFEKVFCERDYQNKRWWSLYASGEQTEIDSALVYDEDSQSYSTYKIALNCLGYGNASLDYGLDDFTAANNLDYAIEDFSDQTLQSYYWQDNQEIFLGGDVDGNVYIVNEDGDDNGASISSTLRTASWNPFNSQGLECQMSYVDLYVDSEIQTTALIEFFKDSDISPYSSQFIDFLPNLGFIAGIQSITQANPAVVNAASHGLSTGDVIFIYAAQGMDFINGGPYTITVVSDNSFSLDGVDSSTANPYTGGGQVCKREFYRERIWKRVYGGGIGNEHSIQITTFGLDRPFLFHAFKPYFKQRGRRTIN